MIEHREGAARFFADSKGIVSSDMSVFYNPLMRENRDLSLLVLSWLFSTRKPKRLIFPMAASGVRPVRMFEELDVPRCEVLIGDIDPRACAAIKASVERSERASSFEGSVSISNTSAQALLASSKHADYIEIDPYGSPLEFLDPALQRITHKGILAVSATDTAALCGTYPKTGLRKYAAFTARSPLMHEHAVRILAHVVERNAARYGKAARIIFAYAHLHYIKLFFEVSDSKSEANRLMNEAEYWSIDRTGFTRARSRIGEGYEKGMIGPLSAQPLYDASLLEHMQVSKVHVSDPLIKELDAIRVESHIVGSAIDLHLLASELGLESVPRFSSVLERLGDRACRTHFCETAIRTSATRMEIEEAMR